ncbi:MAG: phosphatidic acid phosphatase [Ruminococcaceae bacterium]|nr:phosphatidic acid phosphatase [Oscillospiraceae bacterium]
MKKLLKNKINIEFFIVLAVAFLWNNFVYWGAKVLTQHRFHYDITSFIDEMIPFLPWTVSIYFGCYVFWFANYCLCATWEKSERNRFFCADFLAKGICFLIFVLIPTTNVRPEITETGIWGFLMNFLYTVDSADNLFPSIHCLASWLCWIGVRKNKSVSKVYSYISLFIAITICISTLTTRQHVIIDVIGGVLLAELCYFIAGHPRVSHLYSKAISKIRSLFPSKQKSDR